MSRFNQNQLVLLRIIYQKMIFSEYFEVIVSFLLEE